MNLCLSVAAIAALVLQTSAVYAQVKVNAPGVSIKVDIPPDFDINDPTGEGKDFFGKCIDGSMLVAPIGDSKYPTLTCALIEIRVDKGNMSVGEISAQKVVVIADGSGDLKVGKLTTNYLRVNGQSSGNVTIDRGSATVLDVTLGSSGDLNAGNVVARNVKVSLSGSGTINVNATKSIEGKLSGSGDLRYAGVASSVAIKNSGSGKVGKM